VDHQGLRFEEGEREGDIEKISGLVKEMKIRIFK
jgi:hypothetical protein